MSKTALLNGFIMIDSTNSALFIISARACATEPRNTKPIHIDEDTHQNSAVAVGAVSRSLSRLGLEGLVFQRILGAVSGGHRRCKAVGRGVRIAQFAHLHIHIEQWVHTRNDWRCGHIIAVTTEFSLELNNFQMQSRFQRREEQYLKYSAHRPTKTSCGCALM